jgi:hypothetical protein
MMSMTIKRLAAYAAAVCTLMVLSFWTGTSLGNLKSIAEYDRGLAEGARLSEPKSLAEYERGFADGRKDALYTRPVSEELEMVCLGLWTATLIEKKEKAKMRLDNRDVMMRYSQYNENQEKEHRGMKGIQHMRDAHHYCSQHHDRCVVVLITPEQTTPL